ncbi:MAG TPA: RNA polymerase sigma factor, partial [Ktedonobacteraceae bacterium]|nr:RNA polymerase sigma factor [Ktedonobacteraceae bacterium]
EPKDIVVEEIITDITDGISEEQDVIDDLKEVTKSPEQVAQQVLVDKVLQGDKEAFGAIVDQYTALMMRTALMIIGDRDIAADAVQDALIQAWQHLSGLREAGALRPWLMRIVVNQCISYKRKAARTAAFVRQTLVDQSTQLAAEIADDHKGRLERDWDLAETVKKLPPKQQAVIMLHYYQGMTLPSMAQTLNISENTLKKRIQAALQNLRQVLQPDDRTGAFVAL